jgi:hypothetical protein
MLVGHAQHHVGIHLDEAAIAVIGETLVSAATVSSFKPRLSTVSIMPGIEARAPERTETRSSRSGSPNRRPVTSPTLSSAAATCASSSAG